MPEFHIVPVDLDEVEERIIQELAREMGFEGEAGFNAAVRYIIRWYAVKHGCYPPPDLGPASQPPP